MNMNTRPLMVAIPHQLWQADAGAAAPAAAPAAAAPTADPPVEETAEADPGAAFSEIFKKLSEEEEAPSIAKDKPEETPVPAKDGEGDLPDPAKVAEEAAAAAKANEGKTPEQIAAEKAAAEAAGKPAGKPAEEEKPDLATAVGRALAADRRQQQQEAAEAQRQREAAEAAAKPGVTYTDEETQAIKDYETEFPQVARGEELKRRAEYHELTRYIFNALGPQIRQLTEFAQSISQEQHVTRLQAAVPDYADVQAQVVAWVDKQPPFLKAAYQEVVKQGGPEDVAALIGQWKKDTGYTPPVAEPAADGAAAPAAVPAAGKPPAKVIAALKPSASRRSTVETGGISKDDFSGAFKAFANEK